MFPKYQEIQLPLLAELVRRGGYTRPSAANDVGQTIYESLADHFNLSKEARDTKIRETNGTERSKWENMVRWARNDLRKLGYLSSAERGVWAITDEGEEFLQNAEDEQIVPDPFTTRRVVDLPTFQRRQAEAARIGELGEQHVLSYERQRLQDAGCKDLADSIKQVSIENVAAGYDILSFNIDGSERYIEVKTSKSKFGTFQITAGELKVASRFKDSYWIYRVTNVKTSEPEVRELQNPSKLIKQKKLLLQPSSYSVVYGEELET